MGPSVPVVNEEESGVGGHERREVFYKPGPYGTRGGLNIGGYSVVKTGDASKFNVFSKSVSIATIVARWGDRPITKKKMGSGETRGGLNRRRSRD